MTETETVINNASVIINGTDLSSARPSVTIKQFVDTHEVTTMGSKAKRRIAGLKEYLMSIDFFEDFNLVDNTLNPLLGAPSFTITVIIDKDKSVSVTNPKYEGKFILPSYTPLNPDAIRSVTFESDGELTRKVS